uniref:Chromosome alignment-maintaining phosphoprotein 1 n=1 Tax=Sphenodon punctatus TaxID=8508 RepID=A0A8D0GAV2_SPHPU
MSPEHRRHIPPMRRPASTVSPEPRRPDPAISPDPWRPVPNVSPESWRPTPAVSHDIQKSSTTVSTWPPKPPSSVSLESRRPAPEPRRPMPVVSPEPRRLASEPWKTTSLSESQKSSLVSSEPWKPISSVYPEGWKPVLSPDTWKPAPVSPELRKPGPTTSSDAWKTSFFELPKPVPSVSPEPWKLVPELRKATFFPETQKSAPIVSPEVQKRVLFPEPRKRALFPEPRKSPPVSTETQKRLFFSETQMSVPEVPKHPLFTESQKLPVSPEVQKHTSFSEPQKLAAVPPEVKEQVCFPEPQKPLSVSPEPQKPASAVSPEIQKQAIFTEPQKPLSDVSPEVQKTAISTEVQKPALSSDIQKPAPSLSPEVQNPMPAVSSEAQKNVPFPEAFKPALAVSTELQPSTESSKSDFLLESLEDQKPLGDLLAQEEQPDVVKEPEEDVLYSCPKKKPKKENQESSDTEINISECGNTEMDSMGVKEQESHNDQEQLAMESSDPSKESKVDVATPIQPQCVLQFTEEKEAFISEEEIAKYMKRGKGKYYCKICCCRAMKKGAVLHHLVNKHNVHSPYKCTICNKAFLLESLLKNHVAAHGQSLLKCPRCSFESNFPRGFKKHLTHCQSRHSEDTTKKQVESTEPLEQQS